MSKMTVRELDNFEAQMYLSSHCLCDKWNAHKHFNAISKEFHDQIADAFLAGIKLERERAKKAITAKLRKRKGAKTNDRS